MLGAAPTDGRRLLMLRRWAKLALLNFATALILPELASFWLRARFMGRDRALEGSSQLLALVPGLLGQFVRRAFLRRVLPVCHDTVTVEAGTFFTKADACLEANVYIGPRCQLGLVHIERDALLAAGVHVPSGARTHGFSDSATPIREQPGQRQLVRIGAGSWIGSAAVVMADVGRNTVIGAGAVVTRPLPDWVVAAGVPARVVHSRSTETMRGEAQA
ncbi:MAG: acyltransferase [Gemmataceae bacterium]|nr:acyltransferase [Gemmataceae bacterium]